MIRTAPGPVFGNWDTLACVTVELVAVGICLTIGAGVVVA